MNRLIEQLVKFGIVGVAATLLDFGILTILTEALNIHYLTSAAIGFIVATLFNYTVSMRFVFSSRFTVDEKQKELLLFVLLSVVGLGLNQFFMRVFVESFGIYYVLSKIVATILVMSWNFISRKIWME